MRNPFRRVFPRLVGPRMDRLLREPPTNSSFPQCLANLLIDISGSMLGQSIDQVNRGAAEFVEQLSHDPVTRDTLQVQLVTFGDTVKVRPFVPITRLTPPTFVASGFTPLAEAILKAIKRTEKHSEFLGTAAEVDVLKPHYFLFSDGIPTSEPRLCRKAAAAIKRREDAKQAAFYGFGVNDAAVKALQPLFRRQVFLLGDQDFVQFFRIVSASVLRVSSSSVSDDVDLSPLIHNMLQLPQPKRPDPKRLPGW